MVENFGEVGCRPANIRPREAGGVEGGPYTLLIGEYLFWLGWIFAGVLRQVVHRQRLPITGDARGGKSGSDAVDIGVLAEP